MTMEEKYHGRSSFLSQEIEVAKKIALGTSRVTSKQVVCPACQSKKMGLAFLKWEVPYFTCPVCLTTCCFLDAEEIASFECEKSVSALRCSEHYQDYAEDSRSESWGTLIQWIEHRIFRYGDCRDSLTGLVYGMRYRGLFNRIANLPVFSRLDIKGSTTMENRFNPAGGYDVLLCIDSIQRCADPDTFVAEGCSALRQNGLLFLTARLGTGFDILTLGEKCETIYPYEYVFLPSVRGIVDLLKRNNFEVVETSTPGMLDVAHVYRQRSEIDERNNFVRMIMSSYNERLFSDFQKFLQKHGLSSYVNIVAKKL